MKFEQQFTTNSEYITLLETTLNCTLPIIYKKFLIQNGGGIPLLKNYYKELDTGGVYDFEISIIYGANTTELAFDLYHNNIMMLGLIPNGLICIADDGIGNYICVETHEEKQDQIYIVKETEEDLLNNI